VIVIGEAIRDLVAKRNPSGETIGEDASIVKAHPEIPWVDWIGMRDMVTHPYDRAAPEMLWRDYALIQGPDKQALTYTPFMHTF
jgi:uncharacterized protein with HEPN domain